MAAPETCNGAVPEGDVGLYYALNFITFEPGYTAYFLVPYFDFQL